MATNTNAMSTPGPWEAAGDTVHSANTRFAGMQVADCSMSGRGHTNARLIAAAPELYEALVRMLELDSITNREYARAVLAKVEGR